MRYHIFVKKLKSFLIDKRSLTFLLLILFIAFFAMHFIRIFDNNYWSDESASIIFANRSFKRVIQVAKLDVHPPLYYLILSIGERYFHNYVWIHHLVSVIPYGVSLIVIGTILRNEFGYNVAMLMGIMVTFMNTPYEFNLEARMYSWAALFVFLSFIYLYKIITYEKKIYYVLFVFYSLCAAYTHYYALMAVAFFYVGLLVNAFVVSKQYRYVIICYVATVIGYLPWVIVAVVTFTSNDGGFWLTYIPSVTGSFRYLFELSFSRLDFSKILELVFGITLVLLMVKLVKYKDKKLIIWVMTGCVSIGGSIFVAELLSHLISPVYVERYIYPLSAVAWLIMCVSISQLRYSNAVLLLLSVTILTIGSIAYGEKYTVEREENARIEDFLNNVIVGEDQVILADERMITYAMLGYYYPKRENYYIDEDSLLDLEDDKDYWLFLNHGYTSVYDKWLQENSAVLEEVYHYGQLGDRTIDAYRIIR